MDVVVSWDWGFLGEVLEIGSVYGYFTCSVRYLDFGLAFKHIRTFS